MRKLKLTDEKKKIFKNLLIILLISICIEVVFFNITSYRVFWGKYEKQNISNYNIFSRENGYIYLEFKDINKKVRNIKNKY